MSVVCVDPDVARARTGDRQDALAGSDIEDPLLARPGVSSSSTAGTALDRWYWLPDGPTQPSYQRATASQSVLVAPRRVGRERLSFAATERVSLLRETSLRWPAMERTDTTGESPARLTAAQPRRDEP